MSETKAKIIYRVEIPDYFNCDNNRVVFKKLMDGKIIQNVLNLEKLEAEKETDATQVLIFRRILTLTVLKAQSKRKQWWIQVIYWIKL